VKIPGIEQELPDIAIIRFPATHLLNEIIDHFNSRRDPEN
jgi:hypothetical protein